jgi:hypothetical protein
LSELSVFSVSLEVSLKVLVSKLLGCIAKITANGQGLLQGWNSLLVQPGTAAD